MLGSAARARASEPLLQSPLCQDTATTCAVRGGGGGKREQVVGRREVGAGCLLRLLLIHTTTGSAKKIYNLLRLLFRLLYQAIRTGRAQKTRAPLNKSASLQRDVERYLQLLAASTMLEFSFGHDKCSNWRHHSNWRPASRVCRQGSWRQPGHLLAFDLAQCIIGRNARQLSDPCRFSESGARDAICSLSADRKLLPQAKGGVYFFVSWQTNPPLFSVSRNACLRFRLLCLGTPALELPLPTSRVHVANLLCLGK
jgi:hypothetical protein